MKARAGQGLPGPVAGESVQRPSGHGAPPVVRELTRELLRQQRLTMPEASQIEAALCKLDWQVVWDLLAMGQARLSPQPAPGATGRSADSVGATAARIGSAPPARTRAQAPLGDGAASAELSDAALSAGLLHLVMDLCDGLSSLCGRDQDFAERLAPIRAELNGQLTPQRLDQIRGCLVSLIAQQVQIQRGLQDTRTSLKEMLSAVIERLASVGETTRYFGARFGVYQKDLAGDPDPEVLRRVAGGLLADTGRLAEQILQSQEDLAQARRRVESFESRVRSLEDELEQTARMARNDPLTQVLNRRGLDEVIRTEAARSDRYQTPLTVVLIDLDDFKSINDQMGHAGGDRALVHFVTTAKANLRSTDRIARTGGEEFVLVFPATEITAALDAIRRVQSSLARDPIPVVSSCASSGEACGRTLSFSAGAAQWRSGETLAQILERADAALYRAKQLGKNRVETAAGPLDP